MILSLICLYMKLAVTFSRFTVQDLTPTFQNKYPGVYGSWRAFVPENRIYFGCCEAVVLQDRTLVSVIGTVLSLPAVTQRFTGSDFSANHRLALQRQPCEALLSWHRVLWSLDWQVEEGELFAPSYCLPFTKEFLHFKIILIFFAKSQANFLFLQQFLHVFRPSFKSFSKATFDD